MTKPTPVTSVTTARVRALLIPDSSSPGPPPRCGRPSARRPGTREPFSDDHLDEVFPRSPSVGSAALDRNRPASRAPLTAAPVHHDLDVFLSRKGSSKGLLEIGMGFLDDDVHRPVP